MTTAAEEDRQHRRMAWCVAQLLRHAPDAVVLDVIGRLAAPARRYLCRDTYLPAPVVTLLLRHGTDEDRRNIARNPHVLGRPLPGLPGPARYAARPGPSPELLGTLRAELGRTPPTRGAGPPMTTAELVSLLRRHGSRQPRIPLDVLTLPHELDPEILLREHARAPLPPGSVEALLLVAGLDRSVCLALLDTRAQHSYGPHWHRPAVRAVRTGTLTFEELAAAVAPAHRTLLLGQAHATGTFGWNLAEWAGMRSALTRLLRPELGDDPRLWAELLRHAPGFPGTLPELAARVALGNVPRVPDPAPAPVPGLARAVEALTPGSPWTGGGVHRELALASLAVPNAMGDLREDIRWVRACLDGGLLTGADVLRHKAPAAWALDEDHWLGDIDHPDRHDRPVAVLSARAEADRLFDAALGTDPDAWWRTARALPDFAGTVPELLAAIVHGDSVSSPS
ncbi:hypothetical protein MTF65_21915 [Streptomyces sp. APSN-46.1]|uniref:hypothetical protein n=1 Tax=Streptomyces sp. APSN-46.1 TaxID=2929049 RepID=UPI001FB4BD08|nr:hypothetical protein [Streptomyces sp. APSN-46.1]MCJ1679950.1 hypothetical protein [Streptomyces sp. APSN-46.1]